MIKRRFFFQYLVLFFLVFCYKGVYAAEDNTKLIEPNFIITFNDNGVISDITNKSVNADLKEKALDSNL